MAYRAGKNDRAVLNGRPKAAIYPLPPNGRRTSASPCLATSQRSPFSFSAARPGSDRIRGCTEVHKKCGGPPRRRKTWMQALHIISLQAGQRNVAADCGCRRQVTTPSGKTTGGGKIWRGRSYFGMAMFASVDSTNSSTSPSRRFWPASSHASRTGYPLIKVPLVDWQSRT